MHVQLEHAFAAVDHAPLPERPSETQIAALDAHGSALHTALDTLEALLARREAAHGEQ